jgi:tRNA 2-thiouridine synthesizing protein A
MSDLELHAEGMLNLNFDVKLDITGLYCPLPILKTKQVISNLTNNKRLLVITSDPSFYIDCKVYLRQSGNKLLKSWQVGRKFYYLLSKG